MFAEKFGQYVSKQLLPRSTFPTSKLHETRAGKFSSLIFTWFSFLASATLLKAGVRHRQHFAIVGWRKRVKVIVLTPSTITSLLWMEKGPKKKDWSQKLGSGRLQQGYPARTSLTFVNALLSPNI